MNEDEKDLSPEELKGLRSETYSPVIFKNFWLVGVLLAFGIGGTIFYFWRKP